MEGKDTKAVKENMFLALAVVISLGKYRLSNAVKHITNQGPSHVVPLIGLSVITHNISSIFSSQNDGEHIGVDDIHDVRDYKFAAEDKHLFNRTKVDRQRGVPLGVVEVQGRKQADVDQRLRGNAPVGEAAGGHGDAYEARDQQADERDDGTLEHLHVAEEQSPWRDAETGEEEPDEDYNNPFDLYENDLNNNINNNKQEEENIYKKVAESPVLKSTKL